MLGLGQNCEISSDKVSLFPNKVYLLRNKDALIKITSALIVFTSAIMINTPALSDKANGKMENNSHLGTKKFPGREFIFYSDKNTPKSAIIVKNTPLY